MSESSVSDLVFRDLDAQNPSVPTFDEDREAALREEIAKLRPVRPPPPA